MNRQTRNFRLRESRRDSLAPAAAGTYAQSSHETSWALTPAAAWPPAHTQGKVVSAGCGGDRVSALSHPDEAPPTHSPRRAVPVPRPHLPPPGPGPAQKPRRVEPCSPHGARPPAGRQLALSPDPVKALSRGTPLQPGPCPGGLKHAGESRPFGNSCQRIWAFHPEQHSCSPIFVDKFTGLCVHVGTDN